MFGERSRDLPLQTASEEFSDIPNALGVPYCYWGIGGIDSELYRKAEEASRLDQDIPVNHSLLFAPVIQPTLDTGTEALVAGTLAWLASPLGDHGADGRHLEAVDPTPRPAMASR